MSSRVAKLLYSTIFYIRVGGEENFFHCGRCDMCLGIQLKDSHKVRNNTGNLRCLLKWICAIKLSWTQIISSHIILENSDLFQIVLHLRGMSFILNRVHFISIHFSVFVYMIPKQNFLSVQVIMEWVNSGFQSQWNSRSCTKSCKPKTLFWIENGKWCSLGPVVSWKAHDPCLRLSQSIFQCKCDTNFTLEEKSLWYHIITSYHLNKCNEIYAYRWNELIPEWKSFWYHVNSPWISWLIFHVLSLYRIQEKSEIGHSYPKMKQQHFLT